MNYRASLFEERKDLRTLETKYWGGIFALTYDKIIVNTDEIYYSQSNDIGARLLES